MAPPTKSDSLKANSIDEPSIQQALIPISALVFLLSLSVYLFGADASSGPNQIALCVGAIFAALVGWQNGQSWLDIEQSIVSGITVAIKPLLILFCCVAVGSVQMRGGLTCLVGWGTVGS